MRGSVDGTYIHFAMFNPAYMFARWGALVTLVLALGLGAPARAEGKDCFKTWDEARETIQENGLATGKQISQMAADPANIPPDTDFMEAYLCQEGGDYVYKLYYLDKDSKVVIRTVDARNPFPAP